MSASITLQSRFDAMFGYVQENLVDNDVYFYSGRPFPWDDETSPDISRSDDKSNYDTRRNIIYMYKLGLANTCKMIKRFDWVTDTVYTRADFDLDYTDFRFWIHPEQPFYCMNSEGNVYKCISNNYDSPSTDEPLGQSLTYIYTADGYIWKFMCNISTDIQDDFLVDSWIPIPEDTNVTTIHQNVIDGAVIGAIPFIRVDNEGDQYSASPTIVIEGDGANATATANVSSGKIESITVTNEGTGYTYAFVNIFDSGNGNSAVATAMISPLAGHGGDTITELGAFYLGFSVELKGDTEGYEAWSTYRQVGLIRSPETTTGDPITDDWITTYHKIDISIASGNFSNNEIIIGQQSLAWGYLYHDEAGDDTNIYLYNLYGVFTDGELINGQDSEVSAVFNDADTEYSDFDSESGLLLYKENIQFITRNSIAIEKFVFTIEF